MRIIHESEFKYCQTCLHNEKPRIYVLKKHSYISIKKHILAHCNHNQLNITDNKPKKNKSIYF